MVIFVGLTGNVACGKSTIARHWTSLGCVVLDTDQMGAAAVAPGSPGLQQVLEAFPEHRNNLLLEDGSLNRRYLGQIVFSDRAQKRKLEKIVWPKVYGSLFRQLISSIATGFLRSDAVVVVEVPQLFESGSFTRRIFDSIVVVSCEPPEEQMRRLMKRNPDILEDDARKRLQAQMPQETKRRLASFVVDNSSSLTSTIQQADDILKQIKKEYIRRRGQRLRLIFVTFSAIALVAVLFFR